MHPERPVARMLRQEVRSEIKGNHSSSLTEQNALRCVTVRCQSRRTFSIRNDPCRSPDETLSPLGNGRLADDYLEDQHEGRDRRRGLMPRARRGHVSR